MQVKYKESFYVTILHAYNLFTVAKSHFLVLMCLFRALFPNLVCRFFARLSRSTPSLLLVLFSFCQFVGLSKMCGQGTYASVGLLGEYNHHLLFTRNGFFLFLLVCVMKNTTFTVTMPLAKRPRMTTISSMLRRSDKYNYR